LNCSSGEYGSGNIGRAGLLMQALTRKQNVFAKLDPITEELERGPDGLCVLVVSLKTITYKSVKVEKRANYSSLWMHPVQMRVAGRSRDTTETTPLRKRRSPVTS
jgi:hypothetical protein